jgi:tRNA threonylcarbamoyladenosine biosynthesis protein TsaB
MIVLGFDTSTSSTAVALRLADASTIGARDDPPAGAHPGHATRLLEMAHELLARAGVAWSDVDRIAVGVGPGTFTGLRVGVATARGLAQSLAAELVGISSLRALAAAALDAPDAPVGVGGAVLAAIDARRGEVFAAAYEAGEPGAPRELAPPRALAPQQLAQVLVEAHAELDAATALGDGALRYRAQLEAAGIPAAPEGSPLHRVSAATICELASRAAAAPMRELLPDYRRRPDAELALAGRAGEAPS